MMQSSATKVYAATANLEHHRRIPIESYNKWTTLPQSIPQIHHAETYRPSRRAIYQTETG